MSAPKRPGRRLRPAGSMSQIEQNLYGALTAILDADQVAAALPVLRALVGQHPAGQAVQRRIADKAPAS